MLSQEISACNWLVIYYCTYIYCNLYTGLWPPKLQPDVTLKVKKISFTSHVFPPDCHHKGVKLTAGVNERRRRSRFDQSDLFRASRQRESRSATTALISRYLVAKTKRLRMREYFVVMKIAKGSLKRPNRSKHARRHLSYVILT